MGPECTKYHKKVAQLISLKTKEEYSHVMNHLRTRLRFTRLRSTLIAITGERGKSKNPTGTMTELSFNMVPEMPSYEVWVSLFHWVEPVMDSLVQLNLYPLRGSTSALLCVDVCVPVSVFVCVCVLAVLCVSVCVWICVWVCVCVCVCVW